MTVSFGSLSEGRATARSADMGRAFFATMPQRGGGDGHRLPLVHRLDEQLLRVPAAAGDRRAPRGADRAEGPQPRLRVPAGELRADAGTAREAAPPRRRPAPLGAALRPAVPRAGRLPDQDQ